MTLDEHKQAIRDALRAAQDDGLELNLKGSSPGQVLELYDTYDMNVVRVWGFGDE